MKAAAVVVKSPPLTAASPEVVMLPVRPPTWNRAEAVAVPPMSRSSVMLVGEIAPAFLWIYPEKPDRPGVTLLA